MTSLTKAGLLPPPSSGRPTLLMAEQRTAWIGRPTARLFMRNHSQGRVTAARGSKKQLPRNKELHGAASQYSCSLLASVHAADKHVYGGLVNI